MKIMRNIIEICIALINDKVILLSFHKNQRKDKYDILKRHRR
jgi:hypothetical protein